MGTLTTRILIGRLMHDRVRPRRHHFEYPHYWLAIDLAELDQLASDTLIFSHNRVNVLSIHDRDYLGSDSRPIREKVEFVLADKSYLSAIARVVLVTSPRYFNSAFNPLNLYYIYDASGVILAVIAEVNNTFSDSHLYILDQPDTKIGKFALSCKVRKEFYVSPFNDLKGEYDFFLTDIIGDVDLRLNLVREGLPLIITRFWGKSVPFGLGPIVKTLARYPLLGLTTLIKITYNAALIRLKGIRFVMRPKPSSKMTYRHNGVSDLNHIHSSGDKP